MPSNDVIVVIRRIECVFYVIFNNCITTVSTRTRIFQGVIKTVGADSYDIYVAFSKYMLAFFVNTGDGRDLCVNTKVAHIVIES